VKGIAPNVKIVPIVIYKKKVDGEYKARVSAIVRGINKSWDNLGSDVINISYSIQIHDDVTEAINNAINYGRGGKGCVVVCAAGNGGSSSVTYPANLDNTLAVGAQDYSVEFGFIVIQARNLILLHLLVIIYMHQNQLQHGQLTGWEIKVIGLEITASLVELRPQPLRFQVLPHSFCQ
jgi:hypothetical protein